MSFFCWYDFCSLRLKFKNWKQTIKSVTWKSTFSKGNISFVPIFTMGFPIHILQRQKFKSRFCAKFALLLFRPWILCLNFQSRICSKKNFEIYFYIWRHTMLNNRCYLFFALKIYLILPEVHWIVLLSFNIAVHDAWEKYRVTLVSYCETLSINTENLLGMSKYLQFIDFFHSTRKSHQLEEISSRSFAYNSG